MIKFINKITNYVYDLLPSIFFIIAGIFAILSVEAGNSDLASTFAGKAFIAFLFELGTGVAVIISKLEELIKFFKKKNKE